LLKTVRHGDHALVQQMLAGDERAFEDFFDDYFSRLFRFAMARLDHDGDAAEDVVQATLCKAITKLDTYRGEAALFSWLCTFCRHEISAFFKKQRRVPPPINLVEEIPAVRAALESLAASLEDPEQELQRKEVARLVQVTLDYLPTHYGNALEWKYIQGWSVKEIAERLRLSPKAAESLLTRARAAFREGFAVCANPGGELG
jgi:RNA polymerase sigma-70 factor (ECF subfamily)